MNPAVTALLLVAAVIPRAAGASLPISTAGWSAASAAVSVHLDRTTISTRIGQRFAFSSTLRNESDQPLPGVIAHLNVLSLDPGVYVDPEDWSSRRTSYLGSLPAHASTRLVWTGQAVNSGRFVVYVAVTVTHGTDVSASNALRLAVAQQRTLDAGGVLPLAVTMPATVLLLMGFAARKRRGLR